jgi:hypothetical protein
MELLLRYEAEHGRGAAVQLLEEAFEAAAARLPEQPGRLPRSTDRVGDSLKEETYA